MFAQVRKLTSLTRRPVPIRAVDNRVQCLRTHKKVEWCVRSTCRKRIRYMHTFLGPGCKRHVAFQPQMYYFVMVVKSGGRHVSDQVHCPSRCQACRKRAARLSAYGSISRSVLEEDDLVKRVHVVLVVLAVPNRHDALARPGVAMNWTHVCEALPT